MFFCATDIGKVRSGNQDAVFASETPVGPLPNLFAVADGMGGHNGGEIASQMALSQFSAHLQTLGSYAPSLPTDSFLDHMAEAVQAANQHVFAYALENPQLSGMGTTLTACACFNNTCAVVHVGDSRLYAVTPAGLVQQTHDHSFVAELLKTGQISQEEAMVHPKRNVITRALGTAATLQVDAAVFPFPADGFVLLCSDGLYNMLTNNEMLRILLAEENPVRTLISAANERGGTDNISAIVVR